MPSLQDGIAGAPAGVPAGDGAPKAPKARKGRQQAAAGNEQAADAAGSQDLTPHATPDEAASPRTGKTAAASGSKAAQPIAAGAAGTGGGGSSKGGGAAPVAPGDDIMALASISSWFFHALAFQSELMSCLELLKELPGAGAAASTSRTAGGAGVQQPPLPLTACSRHLMAAYSLLPDLRRLLAQRERAIERLKQPGPHGDIQSVGAGATSLHMRIADVKERIWAAWEEAADELQGTMVALQELSATQATGDPAGALRGHARQALIILENWMENIVEGGEPVGQRRARDDRFGVTRYGAKVQDPETADLTRHIIGVQVRR